MNKKLIALVVSAFLVVPSLAFAGNAERTFKSKCASCHGADGAAKTKQGEKLKVADMTTADWQKEFTDEKIKAAINDGVSREKDGVTQKMNGYKDKLSADEVDELVKYIRAMKK